MISFIAVAVVLTDWCPADNAPNTCGEASANGTSVGDPVDFGHGSPTGYMTRRDLSIPTSAGAISFERTFATRWAPSELPATYQTQFLYSLPKSFGGAAADTGTNWWHNWGPMVLELSGVLHVRTTRGRWVAFSSLPANANCGSGQNIPKEGNQPRESATLLCKGTSSTREYVLVEEDGRRHNFNIQTSMLSANTVRRYFVKSVDLDSARQLTFTYGAPLSTAGTSLPSCSPTGDQSGPYIRSVRADAANLTLDFYYTQSAASSCPIAEVRAREYGVTVASYEYSTAGELRVARTGYGNQQSLGWGWGPQNIESYCGYGSNFRAYPGAWPNCNPSAGVVASNAFDIDTSTKWVTAASTPTESFSIAITETSPTYAVTTWARSLGTNQSPSATMNVVQTTKLAGNNGYHEASAGETTHDCNVLMSCRGTTQSLLVEQRTMENKSIFAGTTTRHVVEGADSIGAIVPLRLQSGGTSATVATGACEGLKCDSYEWARVNLASKVTRESRPSVIQPGGTAETIRSYHANGLPSKTVVRGWSRNINGAVVEKANATFYRMSPLCAGAVAETDKIVEVEGPCAIPPADVTTATQCPATATRPIVHYRFHQPGAAATDIGYLASVRRYPAGCNGSVVLSRAFDTYHPNGKPVYSWDETGNPTAVLHDMGGHVSYSSGPNGTWAYDYENDKLVRAVSPSGLNQIYCYRSSSIRPSMPAYLGVRCDGPWTGRLEWAATTDGNAHTSTVSFYEAMEYQYGTAKNLRTQTFVQRGEGIRRIRRFDADGRGNPSFAGAGDTSTFGETRRYGLNGELAAIGFAFQQPDALCGPSDTAAGYCTTLGYDTAGRAISVSIPTSSGVFSQAKFAYDEAGNACQMSTDGTTPSCAAGTTPNSAQSRTTWEHDDLGNVVSTWVPGTGNASLGANPPTIPTRREYNSLGKATAERTPWMQSSSQKLTHDYDALGRKLLTSIVNGTSPTTVAAFAYDYSYTVPSNCAGANQQANVFGRLSVEQDVDATGAAATTFYSYTPAGRLAWEARVWGNRAARCSVTRYSYRADGQLERMYYPSGLDVRYVYGANGRPSSIELTQNGATQVAFSNIVWEPFGRVASYSAVGGAVSYALGQTQATPNGMGSSGWTLPQPSAACPSGSVGIPDGTGLVRRMTVTNPGTGNALLTEDYRWGADQLLRSSRCYNGNNGGAPALETTHKYDLALRLSESASSAGGGLGPIGTEGWRRDVSLNGRSYDFRCVAGNPASCPYQYKLDKPSDAQPPVSIEPNDSHPSAQPVLRAMVKRHSYNYSVNGALGTEYYSPYPGDRYALGISNSAEGPFGYARIDSWSSPYPSATTTLAQTVSIQTSGAPVVWSYSYDSRYRRRIKASPTLRRSFFTYNQQSQLIEEVREPALPGQPEIVEEHVYLAGMPIATVRSLFAPGTGTRTTMSSACAGMQYDIDDTTVSCGTRFVFTEPVTGKIALITDSAARIVWTGEYQPMGARNRQEYWGGVHDTTKAVYCDSSGSGYAASYYCGYVTSGCTNYICGAPPPALGQPGSFAAPWPGYTGALPIDQDIAVPTQLRAGLDMKVRVRFAHFDMEPGQDFVQIRNANNTIVFSASGYENGPVRTGWLPMSTDVFGVKFLAGSSATSNYPGKWFAGAHMEGYEWTRFTPGAEPFASPFGLYGMYYDEETEKYLNWHRFYDPFGGRYLSPEPMLSEPGWVQGELEGGFATPPYSYARSNPITTVDPNGLMPFSFSTITTPQGIAALAAAGFILSEAAVVAGQAASSTQSPSCASSGGWTPSGAPLPIYLATAATAAFAVSSPKLGECAERAGQAMLACLTSGKSFLFCSSIYDVVFEGCMGSLTPSGSITTH